MIDEPTIELITNVTAWFLIIFWVFIWIGFLTSIVLARLWLCCGDKQAPSTKIMAAKSMAAGDNPLLPGSTYPGVSLLKPLTGADEVLSHNLESWFKLRYPVFELLFCVHDVDDAAVPVVNALIDKYPGVDAKLVISGGAFTDVPAQRQFKLSPVKVPLSPMPSSAVDDDADATEQQRHASSPSMTSTSMTSSMSTTPGSSPSSQMAPPMPVVDLSTVINPKIRNILPAYESCKHDLVFISDCNIEAEPETLHDVVAQMGPRVGSVCQMHFVKDPPSHLVSFGSIVNKVFFGTQNAKALLFLALLRVTTTVSAAMLIRKSALDDCGGLRAFGCYLAEDLHIGLALAKRGWRNKLGSRLAWQNPASSSVNDVFQRLIRWKRLRQTTNPILVIADPLSECIVSGLTASWALSHLVPTLPFLAIFLAHCLAWFIADFLLLQSINKQPLKFSKFAFLLAWLVRELAAPVLHLQSLLSRRVVWRGQEYYLRLGGRTERLPSRSPPMSPISHHPHHLMMATSQHHNSYSNHNQNQNNHHRRAASLTLATHQVPVVDIDHANASNNNDSNNYSKSSLPSPNQSYSPSLSLFSSSSSSSHHHQQHHHHHQNTKNYNMENSLVSSASSSVSSLLSLTNSPPHSPSPTPTHQNHLSVNSNTNSRRGENSKTRRQQHHHQHQAPSPPNLSAINA